MEKSKHKPVIVLQEEDWDDPDKAFIEKVIEVYEERKAQEHQVREALMTWSVIILMLASGFFNVQFALFLIRLGGH